MASANSSPSAAPANATPLRCQASGTRPASVQRLPLQIVELENVSPALMKTSCTVRVIEIGAPSDNNRAGKPILDRTGRPTFKASLVVRGVTAACRLMLWRVRPEWLQTIPIGSCIDLAHVSVRIPDPRYPSPLNTFELSADLVSDPDAIRLSHQDRTDIPVSYPETPVQRQRAPPLLTLPDSESPVDTTPHVTPRSTKRGREDDICEFCGFSKSDAPFCPRVVGLRHGADDCSLCGLNKKEWPSCMQTGQPHMVSECGKS